MDSPCTILILAAGAASRMQGGDKLLERVDGVPQIRRIAEAAVATEVPVLLALAPDRPARAAALHGLPVSQVWVPDAAEGLSASIRAGVAAVPADQAVMLLLADLPEITAQDLDALLQAAQNTPGAIWRATAASGAEGHPVIIPAPLVPELATLTGDSGAREVVRRHRGLLRLLALPGEHATTDLDTPEDWARWRAAHPGR